MVTKISDSTSNNEIIVQSVRQEDWTDAVTEHSLSCLHRNEQNATTVMQSGRQDSQVTVRFALIIANTSQMIQEIL